ncbi:protein unc-13 homolog D-like isoform X2 [Corticium candelabrum]|uniref:protein unc-13 homolog D-like isoform X2 n=1 Tax=Corticium candelabrum TaxID=121492 RepID=UPI002E373B0C|nr:protein unc-13 homolog D-like isoform X2 [Corticium candelabrum]
MAATAAKHNDGRRIISLAADYDKEHGIPAFQPKPKIREESVDEPDSAPVPKPKPLKDFRSLPPSQMETRDLISLYWQDMAAAQALKKPERGSLTIQVGYNVSKGQLCVKVLEGHNLPALDRSGKSDPYVTLQPFPFDVFEDSAAGIQKTKTKHRELRPVFVEMFHIRCKPKAITHDKGCAILFTCYDWDSITGDDLIGEAVYLLSGTKEVHSESEVARFDIVTLPLSLPTRPSSSSCAYAELERRTSDEHALKFVERRKKAFKMAKNEMS